MTPYFKQPDGGYLVHCGMAIDGDGSPRCYAPTGGGFNPLDYLANAGHPGNWWALACHHDGSPYIQGKDAPAFDESTKGYFVSMTSLERREFPFNDTRRYINAEIEAYIVVPRAFQKAVPGIVLGCKAVAEYNGRSCEAVVADIGNDFGEASIATAKLLGIAGNPKSGGISGGVTYLIYPGIAANGYRLQAA